MISTLVILAAVTIGILFLVRSTFQDGHSIQRRWEGATRHVAAAMLALLAFTTLFCLLLILDLLEGVNLTWRAMTNVVRLSMICFATGVFLLAVSLLVTRKILK
jgi:hypothetical protein